MNDSVSFVLDRFSLKHILEIICFKQLGLNLRSQWWLIFNFYWLICWRNTSCSYCIGSFIEISCNFFRIRRSLVQNKLGWFFLLRVELLAIFHIWAIHFWIKATAIENLLLYKLLSKFLLLLSQIMLFFLKFLNFFLMLFDKGFFWHAWWSSKWLNLRHFFLMVFT
jgi:hypothetical protein